MKLEKNKIIFIGLVVCIIAFIVLYAVSLNKETEEPELKQPKVPELKDVPEEYGSKLEAVDAIKEERETPKPSLYGKIDSTGTYDPLLEEKERQRIVDSIYREGRIDYAGGTYRKTQRMIGNNEDTIPKRPDSPIEQEPEPIDFSKAHRDFFGHTKTDTHTEPPMAVAVAMVNGEQTVRANHRLELRLREAVELEGKRFERNTLFYGFVSFRANRIFVAIDHIGPYPISLKAYDLLDGREGIYVENSYREEATREVLDDAIQDINVPGMPQLNGIKQVFRRSNRTVKVTIHDQYQLILKP